MKAGAGANSIFLDMINLSSAWALRSSRL